MSDSNSSRITARWIFPGDGEPIENGLIEITDGLITDVTTRRGAADSKTVDLGNAAIIPGLVNAHAHLEFADLSEPIQPAAPFTDWIQSLLAYRRERTEPLETLIARGQQESADAGVSLVGDIVTGDWTPGCVQSTRPAVVAFRELIGLRCDQAAEQLEIAKQHIERCRNSSLPIQPAISPHAPYSVGLDLFRGLIALAKAEDVPVCLHLAETQAELELLSQGTGELVDMLCGFGIWQDGLFDRGLRPLDYLRPIATLNHPVIAHGNYLSQEEIEFLGRHSNVAVAYCPRTHQFFRHSEHPWQRLIEAGALVCLGTDGCSSNPDYSLWSEVTFLDRETRGRCRPQLLELATVNGARALGLGDTYGSLTPGRIADFCVVHLPDRGGTDSWDILFSPESRIGNTTTWSDRKLDTP